MSCVNVLKALMMRPLPFSRGMLLFTENDFTHTEAAAMFRNSTYFDYCRGHFIKTDFNTFSFGYLVTLKYDKFYFKGAAQSAINNYNKIPPYQRFDINDSYDFEKLTGCVPGGCVDKQSRL
jgi:hypothetical protein